LWLAKRESRSSTRSKEGKGYYGGYDEGLIEGLKPEKGVKGRNFARKEKVMHVMTWNGGISQATSLLAILFTAHDEWKQNKALEAIIGINVGVLPGSDVLNSG